MKVGTHHVTIQFNGALNYYFSFEILDCAYYPEQIDKIAQVKADGYLYVQGCRITNNKEGIHTVLSCLYSTGSEDSYSDYTLTIDSNGYVIVAKRNHSSNKIDRFLCKLFNH